MTTDIIILIFLLGFPRVVILLENRYRIVRWISSIILCYVTGIVAANIPGLQLNGKLLEAAWGISIFLAIPLFLFRTDLVRMLRQVKPALLSFSIAIAGVLLFASAGYFLYRGELPEAAAVSGMLVGVYTGGTPNMSAIGLALGVEEEVFILLNSADIVFSGIYFVLLLTVGRRLLGRLLPDRRRVWNQQQDQDPGNGGPGGWKNVVFIAAGLGGSCLIFALSAGLAILITGRLSMPWVILGVTTLGIAASLDPRVRKLPGTYATANYLILVFALAMGSMADFSELLASSKSLFVYCGLVLAGSIVFHFLIACIFRIDRDTMIIASTAAIFGPAFIGPVANVIGNRQIIATGITLGLVGYAVGNYLGLGLAYLLK